MFYVPFHSTSSFFCLFHGIVENCARCATHIKLCIFYTLSRINQQFSLCRHHIVVTFARLFERKQKKKLQNCKQTMLKTTKNSIFRLYCEFGFFFFASHFHQNAIWNGCGRNDCVSCFTDCECDQLLFFGFHFHLFFFNGATHLIILLLFHVACQPSRCVHSTFTTHRFLWHVNTVEFFRFLNKQKSNTKKYRRIEIETCRYDENRDVKQ